MKKSTMLYINVVAVMVVLAMVTPAFGLEMPLDDSAGSKRGPVYDTMWFDQILDHFEFTVEASMTFKQRYLVSTKHFNASRPAIFFYTGNEGPITGFAGNLGQIWENAADLGAAVIFAEHRYYGETLPFGEATFNTTENLRWLTSEQALSDYVLLIAALKDPASSHYLGQGAENAAVITFGGSYGGLLSAYIRIKYPGVVAGAVASSAPIWLFPETQPAGGFLGWVTKTFTAQCPQSIKPIRSTWETMLQMAATPTGLKQLSSTFSLCQPLSSLAQMEAGLWMRIEAALIYLAMADYPYPVDYFGPLPGNPVETVCPFFDGVGTGDDAVEALASAVALFYNYTGEGGECFALSATPGDFSLNQMRAWNYQFCTEMTLAELGSNGVTDFFYPAPLDLKAFAAACAQLYPGIVTRPDWVSATYTSKPLRGASNIVFANGLLDPCTSGSPMVDQGPSVVALNIADAAHHFDLFGSNPADPQSVIDARIEEREYIVQWIAEWLA
ncbi:prolylcarboxypeptidase [Thecamonas trahens ATCC 50062]|uniref:Prolylcarboxypeptidase n=1 Tax=Thecamonas trahens ATCC 50062 TaxID=461836 RepID=A0A0L0DNU7_THETB|nr:prolylcarboxypeptidase [Thecamonas trahens ATCC 50062]KNC53997.1 prolylcarboxypeptidase [Thecamonas trahens ATCC 50062]|eukprot:XP_013754198.1 prolylcarboxypeptidase [Thecamonas trahens ATCC 50062]